MNSYQRQHLDVEAALQWVFREELRSTRKHLPKSYPNSPMLALLLGTRIDNSSAYANQPLKYDDTHPDALIICDCLVRIGRRLRSEDTLLSFGHEDCDDFGLAPGFRKLVEQRAAINGAIASATSIVKRSAINGRRPEVCSDDKPLPSREWDRHNRVKIWRGTQVIGFESARKQKMDEYISGSYCKIEWEPNPQLIIESRAEYLIWWATLVSLAEELSSGAFQSMELSGPSAPPRPWIIT